MLSLLKDWLRNEKVIVMYEKRERSFFSGYFIGIRIDLIRVKIKFFCFVLGDLKFVYCIFLDVMSCVIMDLNDEVVKLKFLNVFVVVSFVIKCKIS